MPALHRTEGWHAESLVRRLDGTTAAAEVSASLIRDGSGSPIGVMASFVDITERKRLESQFRQAQKMDALGHLASGIVHDVNNLLTAISGYAQLELLGLPPDVPACHSLSQIKIATDRGKGLTQQLRVFTRQATGEQRLVDLNQLVEETVRAHPADLPAEHHHRAEHGAQPAQGQRRPVPDEPAADEPVRERPGRDGRPRGAAGRSPAAAAPGAGSRWSPATCASTRRRPPAT